MKDRGGKRDVGDGARSIELSWEPLLASMNLCREDRMLTGQSPPLDTRLKASPQL